VSFLVMKSRGIEKALAFDPDFSSEGFSLFSG
jgi:predicted nucleic acid-binding protein